MKRYILKRFVSLILVLFVVSVMIFALVHLTPGDPARIMLGEKASEAEVAQQRELMGLNDPIVIQYFNWVGGLFVGDFGESYFIAEPMTQIIGEHLSATISITVFSLIIAIIVAIPLGIIAAKKRATVIDQSITVFSLLGISTPGFLVAMLLMMLFSVQLGILPVAGYVPISQGGLFEHLKYLLMPCVAMGFVQAAFITRMTRASMLDVLYMDYIKMARAKGVREKKILRKHALRNALPPIITIIGQSLIGLLAGAIILENLFNIPGLGKLMMNSVMRRDYEVVQAIVLMISMLNVIVTFVVDLLYALVDPRVKME